MKSLVLCPCGHPLTRHAEAGCTGERAQACACPYDADKALDAAILDARSDPARWPFTLTDGSETA